jgi:hypothetical protein
MEITGLSPMSEVRLLKNVPLDNTYKNTLTFANSASQVMYFNGKVQKSFTNLKPFDVRNAMLLPCNAYTIYDCNYLMFQNDNFSGRWLYAFITNIEFMNINACKVSFELDVMQTWYFDYTLKESFVIREHVNDDTIGLHITDENLDTGEYIRTDIKASGKLEDFKIVIAVSYDNDLNTQMGQLYSNVYSGLSYMFFERSDTGVTQLNNFIKGLADVGKSSMIVAIFMCPATFITTDKQLPAFYEITPTSFPATLNGYTPKNNKLLCYPYNFLYVSDNQGKAGVYRYEFFLNHSPSFQISGALSPAPVVFLSPKNYKGIGTNVEEKLILNDFPQCCWNNNVFANWLAQNQFNIGMNVITNGLTMASGGIAQGASGIANEIGQVYSRSIQPAQAVGNIGGSANLSNAIQDFFFYPTCITLEYAERIDNYFSMFGYKVNALKVPNIYGRAYWNYVLTKDVNIVGSVPFNDMQKIKSVYNAGVTFWHGDYVGNYSQNNAIV